MKTLKFPNNFLWGSATAAHQVEGNNVLNDWYLWENKGKIKDRQKSGAACDHYNRFREDIDLLASLNQNAYRFSIEWSRIEPERGKINHAEINHYRDVLQYLRDKNIKSFVTLHHFTNPVWFDWESKTAITDFTKFAELIAKEIGHLIDFWCTINEPNILAKHGYLEGDFPPGRTSMESFFKVLDNMIAGHNAAYTAIHKFVPGSLVGMAQNNGYYHSATNSRLDELVVAINHEVRNKYFLDRTIFDFIGLNYYSPKKLKFDPNVPKNFYSSKVKSSLPISDMDWEIFPEGIYHILMELKKYNKPVYITENGLADSKDKQRKEFIRGHLEAIHRAISDGIDVRGYLYWSLMDNFEWGYGYGPRFGLLEVDYSNQNRTVRDSARWYAEVCKNNSIEV